MKTGANARAESGMSLLEVLIALSILAVGLLGLAALQITAIQGNATSHETVAASYYGQGKIEEFRRTAFDNVSSSLSGLTGTPERPNLASIPTDNAVESMVSKKGVRIYRVWAVSTTTATLKTLTVWTCWQEQQGRWRTVQFVTRKGNVL